jgi:acetyl esterase/lipase
MRRITTLFLALLLPVLAAAEGPAQSPQPARPAFRPPEDVQLVSDVVYGKGGKRDLKLDIVRPKAPAAGLMPVVVYVHGGGWSAGSKEDALPALVPLARRGYFCATVEYRLSGEAPWPAQIEDCKCAIRFLRAKASDYGIDPQRMGVWGASAGGHLVAMLGATGGEKQFEGKGGWPEQSSRVQAVCDWFGPADLTWAIPREPGQARGVAGNAVVALLGGPGPDLMEKARLASPVTYVAPGDPPFLIMHGDKDPLVPLSQSEKLRDALQKAKVEVKLDVVEGAGHGFGGPAQFRAVLDFFNAHLLHPPKEGPPEAGRSGA